MGFADFILASWQACVPFSGLSFPVASLAEPLGVALDMSYTADIRLGNEVLVLGLGPIGLMSIPIVRRLGAARIYAVNRSGGKRADLARHYGADEVILVGDAPLRTVPFRKGIDRALVSATPEAIANAMPVMNYGGILSYIGIAYGEQATVRFDANDFHFKKLQLRASDASPAIYFPAVLQLLKDRHVDGAAIISHTMPLEKIGEAMLLALYKRDEVSKMIITPFPEASRIAFMAAGRRRGLAQSVFQVGGNTGSALGPLLAALVVMPRGQHAVLAFRVLALVGVVVLWRVGRWHRQNPHRLRPRSRETGFPGGHRRAPGQPDAAWCWPSGS